MACQTLLPWKEAGCYQCGLELVKEQDSIRCYRCQSSPPYYDQLIALFNYQPPIKKMLSLFKFSRQLAYGRVLGELLAQKLIKQSQNYPEAIIPVPLHKSRLIKRGFNQAIELALPIENKLNIPVLRNGCYRVKNTRSQQSLPKAHRSQNIQSAFQVKKQLLFEKVAIVDDVVTTGNTVNELSRVLKEGGVSEVVVWAICRA